MSDFADKIRTIGAPRRMGTSRTIVKTDERDGSVAGFEKEHWDDRRDATVTPKPAEVHLSMKQGG